MQTEAIRTAVLGVIAAIAPEADLSRLRPDQPLRTQVDLDSMDWLNVIAGLHEKLSVDVPERDYARLTTLDSTVEYLASRLDARRAAPEPRPTASVGLPVTRHRIGTAEVTIRPIRAGDLPLEADFVRHLSAETRYGRFMVTVAELPKAKLRYLTDVDQVRHVALVATIASEKGEAIVGVARYIVDAAGISCEFAVALDDGWHGTGLAGILMQELIDIARARGLRKMEGFVLATNTPMLRFARQLGFTTRRDPEDRETVHVTRPL
jgi:GNAT superfamily N-acetyltransferase/acyl carrier protein